MNLSQKKVDSSSKESDASQSPLLLPPSSGALRLLNELPFLSAHPQSGILAEILTGETNISSAGFPYISERNFRLFIENIPHLFSDGQNLLSWIESLEDGLNNMKALADDMESMERAIKVLRTVVYTAGVTSPPDLWLLRQILSTHREIGTLERLAAGHAIDLEEYASEHGLSLKQLSSDFHFLYARGYVRLGDGNFIIANDPAAAQVIQAVSPISEPYRINLVPKLVDWFSEKGNSAEMESSLREWLSFETDALTSRSWHANLEQIELGYRVLPVVLGLRVLGLTRGLYQGIAVADHIPNFMPEMESLFTRSGYVQSGEVTALGARVFSRGPGPFGIIAAYHPYLNHLRDILGEKPIGSWVHRGENVAASQDANRKTFEKANDKLDQFCTQYGFQYDLFIEHAVGQGEASRQRYERSGEKDILYFGADLEDAAIEQAIEQQNQGHLPQNMQFIPSADIGEPHVVIDFLAGQDLMDRPAVMMVGNGFHEIRSQTNEKMIAVFKAYHDAGFVLIFTEESALHDEALLNTAWNTYHTGFRYIHEISGQGLRPAYGGGDRWSWRKCASLGGYSILPDFSYRSRTIYPHKRPEHKNPSISETYFCIPAGLKAKLKIA